MLNNQKPLPVQRHVNGDLDVHSVFFTLQGEGPFAGRSAVFIRLAGCNLQCPWCDTEYTGPEVARMNVQHIFDRVTQYGTNFVVITGGEPFRQNINPLVRKLLTYGYRVQVETNGTLYIEDLPWDDRLFTVVCSPKTGNIHPLTAKSVHAYKYVLQAGHVAEDGLPVRALQHTLGSNHDKVARPPSDWLGPIYVNPMDAKDPEANAANRAVAVESALANRNHIFGIQLHKEVNLP